MRSSSSNRSALVMVAILFFMFGFLTCLNDILVPHLKALFTLNYTQAMLVQFCFFSAYFLMSLPSGWITSRFGYQQGAILGLATAGFGALGFYPAAELRSWMCFLLSLFILASGITLIQVAINPYVTVLGDPDKAASRLNLVQAFNSLGTTIAPSFGAFFILKNVRATSVQGPYLVFALVLFLTAGFFGLMRLPQPETQSKSDAQEQSLLDLLREHPLLAFGLLAIFCYVGSEVCIGSFMVSWLKDTRVASLSAFEAGKLVSFYWGGAMVGRFVGTWFLSRWSPARILQVAAVLALSLVLVSMGLLHHVGMVCLLLVGCFNSIMFPTIFALSLKNLGPQSARASGLLCMAIVGGAILPLIQGRIADTVDLRWSYLVPVIGYLVILSFARKARAYEVL